MFGLGSVCHKGHSGKIRLGVVFNSRHIAEERDRKHVREYFDKWVEDKRP
jgi:hypothetical protein